MNKCVLNGRLARDPELRYTPSGKAVVGFTLAVKNPFKKDRETGEATVDWLDCEAWEQRAEFISNYAAKGDQLLVVAQATNNDFNDKDGNKVRKILFNVSEVEIERKKGDGSGEAEPDRRKAKRDEDEEERPKAKRRPADEDEDRPKKRRTDDEEEEKPKAKRRPADEDEDEKPKAKRRADDDDERPKSKAKKSDEDGDDPFAEDV